MAELYWENVPNTKSNKTEEPSKSSPVATSFGKTIQADKIIGLPPSYVFGGVSYGDSEIVRSSMPIMAIYPAYPGVPKGAKVGLQTFILDFPKGRDKYETLLKSVDIDSYTKTEHCIYVAFMNDASISESFGAEYGESKFEQIGNIASSAAEELRYITGSSSLKGALKTMGQQMGGLLGGAVGLAGGVAGLGEAGLTKIGGAGIAKILSGSKIDFPQMWKGSSYSPSYSVSVRLYNYNPTDADLHKKYIVDPLAKLLAFIIPISDSDSTFTYPLICSISCPGLFRIKAAYISSIEVIKGGDSNNISYIQRPGLVDIKLTFNDLYSSIVAQGKDVKKAKDPFRPTFKDYIEQLNSESKLPYGPGTVLESSIEVVEDAIPSTTGGEATDSTTNPYTRITQNSIDKVNEINAKST